MSEKLKRCPFCGGNAKLKLRNVNSTITIWCECTKCNAKTEGYCPNISNHETAMELIENCKEMAIEAWNIRKPMERIVERLEKYKKTLFLTIANTGNIQLDTVYENVGSYIDAAIDIVKEEGAK